MSAHVTAREAFWWKFQELAADQPTRANTKLAEAALTLEAATGIQQTVPPWDTLHQFVEALGGDPAAFREPWERAVAEREADPPTDSNIEHGEADDSQAGHRPLTPAAAAYAHREVLAQQFEEIRKQHPRMTSRQLAEQLDAHWSDFVEMRRFPPTWRLLREAVETIGGDVTPLRPAWERATIEHRDEWPPHAG